ncbi:aminotransferase class I/II-fold pyridoxal phosphate-dependent enzyme [Aureimonas sp. AU40]|uniref:aminotransferase class I/II-fold pyridoxal phosphate-dependent enzyme n=1 Tax=Aureimonas sp. AU40 TaxID=1637747 RepID=UPI000783BEAD|nr:aminotransferase class I/II-fold pyridoxal phosphate-dependent enzyme [Aureimonas sp. AU40]
MSEFAQPAAEAPLQLNPHVAALPAYNAGLSLAAARQASGREDIARLASNENPDGCSPRVLEALAGYDPSRYADPACTALRAALGAFLDEEPDRIVCGNGSEEMIAAISRAALQPGREVLTVAPSFGLHEIEPLAVGARVRKIAMRPDFGFDLDALAAALARGPALVFLSSPWNPVGPALNEAALTRLAEAARGRGTLFVLDEAYFEYGGDALPDARRIFSRAGLPFAILRTFSKAYGLAGLRVGYAIASSAALARAIAAAKTPFNVNGAAQIAALAALADQDWMRASVRRLEARRAALAQELEAAGFRTAPSHTNFLFMDCGGDSAAASAALLAKGIIVKPWREPGFERYLRVTIGTSADNERFLLALIRWSQT